MKYFHLAMALFLASLLVCYFYVLWRDYKSTPAEDKESKLDHLWALGKGSATKVWLRLVGIVGTVLTFAGQFADMLQIPQVSDAIRQYLPPDKVSAALLIIAVIGTLARSRSQDGGEKSIL
jgi:hypothetical protein